MTDSLYPWDLGRGRTNNIDFLRLFLAVVVIFSHSFDLWEPGWEPLNRWTTGQITFGGVLVASFFVLSGYLITHSFVMGRGAGDFLLKRVKRIYPGFIAAYFFSLFVIASLSVGHLMTPNSLSELFNHATRAVLFWEPGVERAFPNNTIPRAINGSLWTIRYEFGCYLGVMVPGVVGLLRRRFFVLLLFLSLLGLQPLVRLNIVPVPSLEAIQFPFTLRGQYNSLIVGQPHTWLRLSSFFVAGSVAYLHERARPAVGMATWRVGFDYHYFFFSCGPGTVHGPTSLWHLSPALRRIRATFAPAPGGKARGFFLRGLSIRIPHTATDPSTHSQPYFARCTLLRHATTHFRARISELAPRREMVPQRW